MIKILDEHKMLQAKGVRSMGKSHTLHVQKTCASVSNDVCSLFCELLHIH
jgi:hypothetical protein